MTAPGTAVLLLAVLFARPFLRGSAADGRGFDRGLPPACWHWHSPMIRWLWRAGWARAKSSRLQAQPTAIGATGRRAGSTSRSSISWPATSPTVCPKPPVQHIPADRDHPPGITNDGGKVIVRHLDPAESEIERFSLDQFRQVFHVPESDDAGEKAATAVEKLFPESQRPDELWIYVLWILLFLLVREIFVANRTPA